MEKIYHMSGRSAQDLSGAVNTTLGCQEAIAVESDPHNPVSQIFTILSKYAVLCKEMIREGKGEQCVFVRRKNVGKCPYINGRKFSKEYVEKFTKAMEAAMVSGEFDEQLWVAPE